MGGFAHISGEVDDILRDYPGSSPGELAASFEKSKANYDGTPEEAAAIVAELRRRHELAFG